MWNLVGLSTLAIFPPSKERPILTEGEKIPFWGLF